MERVLSRDEDLDLLSGNDFSTIQIIPLLELIKRHSVLLCDVPERIPFRTTTYLNLPLTGSAVFVVSAESFVSGFTFETDVVSAAVPV